jgi:hypothetical protein
MAILVRSEVAIADGPIRPNNNFTDIGSGEGEGETCPRTVQHALGVR